MADFDNERLDEYKKILEDYKKIISKNVPGINFDGKWEERALDFFSKMGEEKALEFISRMTKASFSEVGDESYSSEDELRYFNKYLDHVRDYVEKKKETDPEWYSKWQNETIEDANNIIAGRISSEDKEKREIHLRDLYQGRIQGPIQLKPYDFRYAATTKDPIRKLDMHKTYYESYEEYAKEHLDEIAVYIYDTKKSYTHREILSLVEKAKIGLKNIGVNEYSIVALMLDGSIEQVITPLAVSKIGGVVKFPDYSKHPTVVRKSLLESNISYFIIEKRFYDVIPELKDTLNDAEGLKIIVGETERDTDEIINYNTIMKLDGPLPTIGNKFVNIQPEKGRKLEIIINSSGTSGEGIPKPIGHTKESMNAAIQKMYNTGFPYGSGNVLIKNIPDPVGLGSIISMYAGMLSGTLLVVMGTSSMEDPLIDYKRKMREFTRNFPEYREMLGLPEGAKLNYAIAPEFARELSDDKEIKDMSFVGSILAAGSAMDESDLNEKDASNREKGCKVPITVFFGHNETCGPITGNTNELNRPGSQGFPVKDVDVFVVHQETYEPLAIGDVGLIIESTDSLFERYPGMPELTEKVKIKTGDRGDFYISGDYGRICPDGRLVVVDRGDNFIIYDDYKFPMSDTSNAISKLPQIAECAVIKKPTENKSKEEMAVFVRVDDGFKEEDKEVLVKSIFSCPGLLPKQIPSEVLFIPEIPYLLSDKPNIAALRKEYKRQKAKGYIVYQRSDYVEDDHTHVKLNNSGSKTKKLGTLKGNVS